MYVTIFVKGFLVSTVSCRVPRFIEFSTNVYKRASLDVCNKKTLAKPPSPNGHLARRDRGLLFSGEEIGRWSPSVPPPLSLSHPPSQMRHLAGVFFLDPPMSRKRRRRPQELSVSPTDFSIKLRKRPAGARWDPPPSPSTDAPSPLSRTKKGVASTPARENSIPRIIQTCRWKDGVRGEKHFNGDYGSRGYSARCVRHEGGCEGIGKKEG